jgi:xanthine dehydrogenase accessory protein XdhC
VTPEALLSGPCALAEVARVRGSAPREAGAWMLVGLAAIWGTIGGGQLEYMAIDAARALLRESARTRTLDVPLGPETGQCCGGRVEVRLSLADPAAVRARLAAEAAARPAVYVHGGGHTGAALCAALAPLPFRTTLVESREAELAAAPPGVARLLAAMPEAAVRAAPPRAAHVILTHDHALDFLIAAEALARGDSPWVGMIGSASKRARFAAFARARGVDPTPLHCPIGPKIADKRPAVIAALVAAELARALAPAPAAAETA